MIPPPPAAPSRHQAFSARSAQLLEQDQAARYASSPRGLKREDGDNDTGSDESSGGGGARPASGPHQQQHRQQRRHTRLAGDSGSSPGSQSAASSVRFEFPTRRQSSARLLRPTQSLLNYASDDRRARVAQPPATSGVSGVSGGGGAAYMVINSEHSARGRRGRRGGRGAGGAGGSGGSAPRSSSSAARKTMREGDMEELFERLYRSASKAKAKPGDGGGDEDEDDGSDGDGEDADVGGASWQASGGGDRQRRQRQRRRGRPASAAGVRVRGASAASGRQRFEVLYEYGSIKNKSRRELSRNGHEQYESVLERETLEKHCTFHPKLAPMTRRMMSRDDAAAPAAGAGADDEAAASGGGAAEMEGFLSRNRRWMLMKERHLREVKSRVDEVRQSPSAGVARAHPEPRGARARPARRPGAADLLTLAPRPPRRRCRWRR